MDDNALARMSWDDLIRMRLENPDDQDHLAPFEHRAYAREAVAEHPGQAGAYALMVPGYQLLKMLQGGGRTGPSMEQMLQGWTGIGEGLGQYGQNALANLRSLYAAP